MRLWHLLSFALALGGLAAAIGCVVENVTPDARPMPPRVAPKPPAPVAPPPPSAAAAAPPPPAPATWMVPAAETTAPAAPPPAAPAPEAASLAPAGDFYSCQVTADCVAVPKAVCCKHGELEAVNTGQVEAYKSSFTCAERQPCPMFMRRDTRVAVCDAGTHRCEMVQPPSSP